MHCLIKRDSSGNIDRVFNPIEIQRTGRDIEKSFPLLQAFKNKTFAKNVFLGRGKTPLDLRKLRGYMREAANTEVFTVYDMALQYFVSGGRISTAGIRSLLKGRGEMNSRISYWRTDGSTIDQIAHYLYENQEPSGRFDTEEFKDAVEDVVLSFNSPFAMAKELLERTTEKQQEVPFDFLEEELNAAFHLLDTLSPVELAEYEAGRGIVDVQLPAQEDKETTALVTKYLQENLGIDVNIMTKDQINSELQKLGYDTLENPNLSFLVSGEKALNVNQRKLNLQIAKEMELKGVPPINIKLATGWEYNAKQKLWQEELEDPIIKNNVEVKFNSEHPYFNNPVGKLKLSEIVDLSTLKEYYPKLEDVDVIVFNTESYLDDNLLFTDGTSLFINFKDYGKTKNTLDFSSREGDLYHEIQHIIQNIEGFERGTTPTEVGQLIINYVNYLREGDTKNDDRTEEQRRFEPVFTEFLNREQPKAIVAIKQKELPPEFFAAAHKNKFYRYTIGEIEASNVASRTVKDSEFRRNTLLEQTEIVGRDIQISMDSILGVKFLSKDDIVYGFYNPATNKIFLTEEYLNSSTLMHELWHLVIPSIRSAASYGDVQAQNILSTMQNLVDETFNEQLYIDRFNGVSETTNERMSSEAYSPREGETQDSYIQRMREEYEANLIGDNATQYFSQIAKENNLNEQETQSLFAKIQNFIKSVASWLSNKLGFNISPEEASKLPVQEVLDRITTTILKGEFLPKTPTNVDFEMFEAKRQAQSIQLEYDNEGRHLAPNGKPSKLTEAQAKLVRTPAFTSWFGDFINTPELASKVLDENGEPLVVYRGTITTMIPDYAGRQFFTPNKAYAQRFTRGVGEINEFFLNIKSPVELEKFNSIAAKNNITGTQSGEGIFQISAYEIDKESPWMVPLKLLEKAGEKTAVKEFKDALKTRDGFIGYDAGFYGEVMAYVIEENNQAKLADGTNTTFSSNVADVRMSSEQIKDDNSINNQVNNIINGTAIFKRFSQKEHRGFIEGGRHHVQATLLTQRFRGASEENATEWETQDSETIIKTAIQRNNGNPLNLAPNGKPSILYQSYKDLGYTDAEAESLVAQTYTDEFGEWFGKWWETDNNNNKNTYNGQERKSIEEGNDFLQDFTNELRVYEGEYSSEDVFNQLRTKYPEAVLDGIDERLGEEAGNGTESIVWANPENKSVIKAISYDMEGSIGNLIDKIVVHNTIFPETRIKVLGVSKLSDGTNTLVVEQSFVDYDNSRTMSREEIVDFMERKGFTTTSTEEFPEFSNGRYTIADLHEGNIGFTKGGNIAVIDFFADIKRENEISKVVDENGQPLVVKHGTTKDFYEFKDEAGWGIYFAKKDNEFFPRRRDTRIINTFLNIRNYLTAKEYRDIQEETREMSDFRGGNPWWLATKVAKERGYNGVFRGEEIIVFEPTQIKSAIENIGIFSPTNPDIRFSIIGEQGASRVEKYNTSLNKAKELEKQGVDISEIEQQTGWYKVNNQWKYLAPELIEQFKIKPDYETNRLYPIQDILQSKDTLLQMYPEISDVKVVFYDNTSKNSLPETKNWSKSAGAFQTEKNILGVNTLHMGSRREAGQIEKTLAHELTHSIARVEGFPLGGNQNSLITEAFKLLNTPPIITFTQAYEFLKTADKKGMTKAQKNIIDGALETLTASMRGDFITLNRQYRHLAGEVDARLVEDVYEKLQRGEKITLPYSQYLQLFAKEDGVDLNNLYFLNNGEVQFSLVSDKGANKPVQITQEIIDRLKQTGLSEDVFLLSTEEIDAKLKELGVSEDVRKQVISSAVDSNESLINGFYSPLEKTINETKLDKLPAKQWADKFAKGEEAKWTGLNEWLGQQTGSVTKADIQNYLKENRIEIVNVVKTEDGTGSNEEVFNDTKFSQYQLEGDKENYKEVLVTLPKKEVDYKKENERKYFKEKYDSHIKDGDSHETAIKTIQRFVAKDKSLKEIEDIVKSKPQKETEKFKSSHFDEPNILVHLRMNTRTDADGNKVLFLEEVQSDWGQEGKKQGFKRENKRIKELSEILKNDPTNTEAYNEFQSLQGSLSKEQVPSAPFVTDTSSWVKLGLKVALKEAVAQGVDKIAWTTGEQQNERYDLSKQVQSISYEKKSKEYSSKAKEKGQDLYSLYIETKESGYEQFDDLTIGEVESYVGKDIVNKIQNNEGDKENLDTAKGGKKVNTLRGVDLKVGGSGMKGFYGSPIEGALGIVGNVAKSLFKQEPKTVKIDNTETTKIRPNDTFINGKPLTENPWATYLLDIRQDSENYTVTDKYITAIENKHNKAIENAVYSGREKEANDRIVKSLKVGDKIKFEKQITASTQHSIDITPDLKSQVSAGLPLFQKSLKNVGINLITNGFTYKDKNGKDVVVLNKDTADDSTSTHEFNHIFLKWMKENKPEMYNKGMELVKNELGLRNVKYELRRPSENKLIFVDPNKLLERLDKDDPSYSILNKDNQIGNRVEKAKDYLNKYLTDQRAINPKTGERTKSLLSFEPSLVGIYDGKLGFTDGRHRVLAAKEIGLREVGIEIPIEQEELFRDLLSQPSEIQETLDYVKQTQPNLQGEDLYNEILTELTGRKGAELINSKKKSGIIEWIKDFFKEIGQMLGILDMSPQEVAKMTLEEFAEKSAISLLKGEVIKGQQAQEYFMRNADRLPLTLAVFQRPEFVKLQGKMVNPLTVLQSLNQTGIKQIEKELIKQVITDNYQGQKKIYYDELEATVRANIMPLERIETSSYANYGMDNLGDGNYGEAKTLILNAPIEHGVTGHFPGDFKASGRKNIKYVPKQLNDNTWVAVEEGYESQSNENNIYQFVGTAGTKEAVDAWISNYSGKSSYVVGQKVETDKGKGTIVEVWDDGTPYIRYENGSEGALKKNWMYEEPEINKGMFGHIRVWQDGEVFTVAELQSDFYQKVNARNPFLPQQLTAAQNDKLSTEQRKEIEEGVKSLGFYVVEKEDEFSIYYKDVLIKSITPSSFSTKSSSQDFFYEFIRAIPYIQLSEDNLPKGWKIEGRDRAEDGYFNDFVLLNEEGKELERTYGFNGVLDKYNRRLMLNLRTIVETAAENFSKNRKKELSKLQEQEYKKLNKDQKQFIASQKEWEKRMVREVIKEASLSGATSLRFPTPYTLSVIESYLKAKDSDNAPYITDNDFLLEGDRIVHAGEPYIVISSSGENIKVARVSDAFTIGNDDYFTKEQVAATFNVYFEDNTEVKRDEEEQKIFVLTNNKVFVWDINTPTLSFGQPNTYKTVSKENFDIETSLDRDESGNEVEIYNEKTGKYEIDRTQRTVAYKYEQIAEILKQERGEENVEIVTDENGFDWYETKLSEEEINNPVVAFRKSPIVAEKSLEEVGLLETSNLYSPEFMSWFSGSIAVDVNNNPLLFIKNSEGQYEQFSGQTDVIPVALSVQASDIKIINPFTGLNLKDVRNMKENATLDITPTQSVTKISEEMYEVMENNKSVFIGNFTEISPIIKIGKVEVTDESLVREIAATPMYENNFSLLGAKLSALVANEVVDKVDCQ